MSKADIEKKIREFMLDELMKEDISEASANDSLALDSLDQTEMRMFIEEEFSVALDDLTTPLDTIAEIVAFIEKQAAVTS